MAMTPTIFPEMAKGSFQPLLNTLQDTMGTDMDTKPSTLRVLVVEDEVTVAQMFVLLLKLWGHAVHVVHDGVSVMAAVAAFHPHVVLCDIGLPGLNGYEVARQLRQAGGVNRPVLVAVTGYGQQEDYRRGQQAGFDLYMTKPVDPAELEALLASLAPVVKNA